MELQWKKEKKSVSLSSCIYNMGFNIKIYLSNYMIVKFRYETNS
jgi:hypothetical protein